MVKTYLLPCGIVHINEFKTVVHMNSQERLILLSNIAPWSNSCLVLTDGFVLESLGPYQIDGKHYDAVHLLVISSTQIKN